MPLAVKQAPAIRSARESSAFAGSSARFVPLYLGLASIAALSLWRPQRRARAAPGRVPGSMRILFLAGIFPPDRGGPASYVPKVAAALLRRGHHVEVICLSDIVRRADADHSFLVRRIRRGQFWPLRVVATTFAIWRAARLHDLLYVNGLGFESAVAALLAGRPTVHKIVGDYAWERAVGRGWFTGTIDQYQRSPKNWQLRFIDFIRTFPLRLAHKIIVPSQYLRRVVNGWDIPAEKIRVVPNAIVAHTRSDSASLPSWSGRTLITVCRLVPWKGVDGLIRLLPELPEMRLVIAGDGHSRDQLQALTHSIGVESRVLFLGDVPQDAVTAYLTQADAFVLNSSYEGLPHVVLEAFAARTPVIATAAGGTAEIVQHNITGLLVPVGDSAALKSAIEQLWHQPELGRRLANEAAERSREHFDFDAMVASTEETLRAVVFGKRAPNTVQMEAV
jgi:glycosyltransferase involved in cell wall biosynthesis